jgi:hypothetical protein
VVTQRRFVWALLCTLLSAVAVAVFSVVYTGQTNEENNRQWCELLTTLDTAYSATPPQTPTGQRLARSIRSLTRSFDCEAPHD